MELVAIIIALIVPIGVAIWTVRSSAKDTAKQIAALEESTSKQIESIKALSKQMIEASIKQVELEIEKNLFLAKQAKQEWEGINEIKNKGFAQKQWQDIVLQDLRDKKPERDYHLYSKFVKDLNAIKKGLEANKKNLN